METIVITPPVEGVHLHRLPPLTRLHIWTTNTVYQVVVWRGDHVYVRGGTFFPQFTAARLDGARIGGGLLKAGWIVAGLRMEIRAGDVRIVTTPVEIIATERPSPPMLH